jgi:signal transduction histidine kinase
MMNPAAQTHTELAESSGRDGASAPKSAQTLHEEFLARMSHELRTPLNAVIGFARVLEKNKAGNQRPEDLQLLGRMRANGERLLKLVEDVLDQASIERGELSVDFADANVVELTAKVVEHYRPQAAAKGLRLFALLPEASPPVRLDPRRFQQVVGHLLDNAVKFTSSGNIKVTLITEGLAHRPTGLIISDTGMGIAPECIERIFMPFTQLDGTSTRSVDGAGLGLSLAEELCQAMGCRLTVDSEVGKGSRFTIRFPAE